MCCLGGPDQVSMVVAVLTTKDGQGSSTLALSLSWAAAQAARVMLIDADMSGTGNIADLLALDIEGKSIGNLFGTQTVTATMLEQQAIQIQARPKLRVVPGLHGFCGPGVADILPGLGTAFPSLPEELVFLDLGSPLAHPAQESPRQTGEVICQIANRVLVVAQDSPARLTKTVQVLMQAQLPQAELVVCETRGGQMRDQITRTISQHLPGVRLTGFVAWDEKRAIRAEDQAVPLPGDDVLRNLQILQMAKRGK
jgi:MinD-like ATPase involved in chromosome partitioning or flagellar assembly